MRRDWYEQADFGGETRFSAGKAARNQVGRGFDEFLYCFCITRLLLLNCFCSFRGLFLFYYETNMKSLWFYSGRIMVLGSLPENGEFFL
jgi:hypothetical protein